MARLQGQTNISEVERESLGDVISELVSVDGLTFNQIAKSRLLRRAFSKDGYDLPQSPQTTKTLFMKQYRKTLAVVKQKVREHKSRGKRFSISLDESTTMRNRR